MARPTDPSAIDGKIAPPEEHAALLVIGAGPAGTAAAIAAAKAGESVVLIDENPVDPALMAIDAQLYYGGRMSGARPERQLVQLIGANPALEEAMDLGVDVRLGVTAWGLYVGGPTLRALPTSMVGLADGERSWMCGFDRLVLATGARDIALAFPGWELPGVMGANGFHALKTRYDIFAGRRLVVLGSGDLGLETALTALAGGLEVTAVVEVLDEAQASPTSGSEVAAPSSAGTWPPRAPAVGDCAGLGDGRDAWAYQAAWLAALQQGADPSLVICQCEDVSRADLLEVRAPKYLGSPTARMQTRDLAGLIADGPVNQDQIKRLTRACMGVCQARRCREQVALILAEAAGVHPAAVPLAGFRPPVRPLPLRVMSDWAEHPAMSAGWEIWMAIPGQWTPYADVDLDAERAAEPS